MREKEGIRKKDRTKIGKDNKNVTLPTHLLVLLIVTSFASLLSRRVNQQPIVNVNRGPNSARR